MALVFVIGLDAALRTKSFENILSHCCGEKFENFTRVQDYEDKSTSFGFVKLSDVESAGKLMKAFDGTGIEIIPDGAVSMGCRMAFEKCELPDGLKNQVTDMVQSLLASDQRIALEDKEIKVDPVESKISQYLKLGERASYMNDEYWEDLKKFRYTQARNEILEDIQREQTIRKYMKSLAENPVDNQEILNVPAITEKNLSEPENSKGNSENQDSVSLTIKPKRIASQLEEVAQEDQTETTKRTKRGPEEYFKPEGVGNNQICESTVKDIIAEEVQKYLGEAEQGMIDFIYGLIKENKSSDEITEELREVFDDDTDNLVSAVLAKVRN